MNPKSQTKGEPPLPEGPPAPAKWGKGTWLSAALFTVLALGGAGFYLLYQDEPVVDDKTPRAASLAPKHYLEARAQVPRRPTLDPAQFKDPGVSNSYKAARENPELLEKMPCYCGCFSQGHTSNYDCFVDNHGAT